MSLESEIEVLTVAIESLTESVIKLSDLMGGRDIPTVGGGEESTESSTPASSGPRSSGPAKKKKASRKKKAAIRQEDSPSNSEETLTLQELSDQIKPLAQAMGPQMSRIGDIMSDNNWEGLSDIPEDRRYDFFDMVYALSETIKNEAGNTPSWEN